MASEEKKLYLLDGMALVYRAHFALGKNPPITSYGLNTAAILGFANTLLDVLKNQKPTHIAVAFDTKAPTDRSIEFTEYKANREAMPEDLATGLPYVFEMLEAWKIPILMLDGYEADDVIGTLVRRAEEQGFKSYMMTPDKDFAQLVTENTFIYKPGRFGNPNEILGVPEILEKWEIKRPLQVIDILALWGDAVDNIPGIPGIGEKTAKKLIAQYDSVEGLIAHAHELKGKQKENVINFADQGLMSKSLATIILDAPIAFEPEKMVLEEPDKETLSALFAKLEFRTLGKRVFGEDFAVSGGQATSPQMDMFAPQPTSGSPEMVDKPAEFKNLENTPHDYKLVEDIKEIEKLTADLLKQKVVCLDTETTSVDANAARLLGISFSYKKGTGFYVPVNPENQKQVITALNPFFSNTKIEKVGHNIKYDLMILLRHGAELVGPYFDTMLAHYLLDPDGRHKMDLLAEGHLNYSPIPIESIIGPKGKKQGNMADHEPKDIVDYACEDADVTLQLREVFLPQLKEANLDGLLHDLETPLLEVLAEIQLAGVNLDRENLEVFSKELTTDIAVLEKTIYEYAGVEFNIASPKQLGEILFDKLDIEPKPKKTKTGQYSTAEETLADLSDDNEIISHILDFRSLVKLKSTYVDALPKMINEETGRVHTDFSQAVAATGRLSSNNPNLQNIPIRTARGREIRKAFIPRDKDHVLLAADYSQIELRIIADLANEEAMLQAFKDELDIHTATASKVYGVPLEEVTSTHRRNAKMVNFGIIYGISAFGLSQRLKIKRGEAKDIIDAYFKEYPGIKTYMDKSIENAQKHGYVETILGRKRYLRDINSGNRTVRGFAERNAINAPIQGSAADMIKIAMIKIQKELKAKNFKTKMTLQVHDELIFDVFKPELEEIKAIVKSGMETAMEMKVPIKVEMGTGNNWLEAH